MSRFVVKPAPLSSAAQALCRAPQSKSLNVVGKSEFETEGGFQFMLVNVSTVLPPWFITNRPLVAQPVRIQYL